MAIDNEEKDEELEFADLSDYSIYDNVGETIEVLPIDANDCIVHEIRNNPQFEQLFEVVEGIKKQKVEETKARHKKENKEASQVIVDTTGGLSELLVALERELNKKVKRINFFEYEIGGVALTEEDLKIIEVSEEDYETCLADAKKMGKDITALEKIAKKLSRSRSYFDRVEEYHYSCQLTAKKEKLNEDEDFLRKYKLIKSFTGKEYALLIEVFKESEAIGRAVDLLEKNGKESEEIESTEGQIKLIKDAFEKCIADGTVSKEDYDGLIEFIKEAKERVQDKDYDSSEVTMDKSDLGILIYGFVHHVGLDEDKSKSVEEMLKAFREADSQKEESNVLKMVEEAEAVRRADASKRIENNMIVSMVLESGKYRSIITAIQEREKDLYSEKRIQIKNDLTKQHKNHQLAEDYIPREIAALTQLLKMEVREEDGDCYFGDLLVRPRQFELLDEKPKEYGKKLKLLGIIKRDEKSVNRDIAMARFGVKIGLNRGNMLDYRLQHMQNERGGILEAKAEVESDIKIAEFFAQFEEEELHRTSMLFGAIKQKINSQEAIEELHQQLQEITSEKNRPAVMGKALMELLTEGEISKEQYEEMKKYIRGLQDGFRDGTYKLADDFERTETSLGLVVYDCIDIVDEERRKESRQQSFTEQDDNGDREI